ncbi:TRAP transporter substrate-binding protein [Marinobacterium rhizophilum]|uniref:TRAP transporter substrate-binding protein n=1 Tax=Marinobacterium rhizophilum TaxID=420402 RepID=A0ABY5HH46_9GAMM|nr:TRAP transporter substrate-binding protein [Marinobacterium rhizophilum]UTW11294.1 TRAP transporter substrate-binding protein [Marinobacterium rhizophilum]
MNMLKRITVVFAAAVLASWVNATPVEVRIGHVEAPGQPLDQVLNQVAERVKKDTRGEVLIRVFPAAQLGGSRDMTEGVQMGFQQGTVLPLAFLGGFNPLSAVLDIPFLLPEDDSRARQLLAGPFGQSLLQSFDGKGLKGLVFWPGGRKNFSMNAELDSIDDFAGKRFRVMDSKVLMAQMQALGATPVSLPFSDVYMGLQTGGVDGQENPLDSIVRMKFHEVQRSVLLSKHGALENVVLFNPAFWNGLTEEQRQSIKTAFVEASTTLLTLKVAAGEAAAAALLAGPVSVTQPSAELTEALKKAMFPASLKEFTAMTGSEGEQLMQHYFEFMDAGN